MSSSWPGNPPSSGGSNSNQNQDQYGWGQTAPSQGAAPGDAGAQGGWQNAGAQQPTGYGGFAPANPYEPRAAQPVYPAQQAYPGQQAYSGQQAYPGQPGFAPSNYGGYPSTLPMSVPYASTGARIVAAFIDSIIATVAATVIVLIGAATGSSGFTAFMYLVATVGWFLYYVGFEANSGATPGKRMLGIRVVKEDGSPMTWGAAIIRNLLRIVDALPTLYLLGICLMAFQSKKQRVGDMAAGTLVIKS